VHLNVAKVSRNEFRALVIGKFNRHVPWLRSK